MTTAWPSQPGHPQPGSTAALRDANVRRILDTVRTAQRTGSGLSQAQLARRTELSPATISGIVRALAAAGVVDVGPGSGRRGGQVRISRGEQQFVAECLDLPVVTQAPTLDELTENIREAISLHLEGEDLAALGLATNPTILATLELDAVA